MLAEIYSDLSFVGVLDGRGGLGSLSSLPQGKEAGSLSG
jgi:hypothetical protein